MSDPILSDEQVQLLLGVPEIRQLIERTAAELREILAAPTEDATLDALRQCERRVAEARAAGYREGLRVSAPTEDATLARHPEPRDPGRKRGY